MLIGPVGPVEVFFYWAEAVFGNFYWPGAIGSPSASSPGMSPKVRHGSNIDQPGLCGMKCIICNY